MDLEERAIMQKSRRELKNKQLSSQYPQREFFIVSVNQEQFAIYKKGSEAELQKLFNSQNKKGNKRTRSISESLTK